jgi:hypothetical protein
LKSIEHPKRWEMPLVTSPVITLVLRHHSAIVRWLSSTIVLLCCFCVCGDAHIGTNQRGDRSVRAEYSRSSRDSAAHQPHSQPVRSDARKETPMKTRKNPGLGTRMGSVEAALASRTPKDTTAEAEELVTTSVRLPKSMHDTLTDIVYAERKRGNKISIHRLILEGVEKVIAGKK